MVYKVPKDEVGFIPRERVRGDDDTAPATPPQVPAASEPPAPSSDPGHLLTVAEVAEKLQAPRSWVYSHADEIGALHVGKYLRFEWETVMERLRRNAASNRN